MKILILESNASNGGDYLIHHRCAEARRRDFQGAVVRIRNSKDEEVTVEYVNRHDLLIVGGGGAQLSESFIRNSFAFQNIERLQCPVHFMGTGFYAYDDPLERSADSEYTPGVKGFFKTIAKRGGVVGARDWKVFQMLAQNGLDNIILSGCPAWFDWSGKVIRRSKPNPCRIVMSNPGKTKDEGSNSWKLRQVEQLTAEIRRRFPDADLAMTFNDGFDTKHSAPFIEKLMAFCRAEGIEMLDLSLDSAKFRLLDEYDLHIGFRVHTHIYCLSMGIRTLLIEEDIRGLGMNLTLGFPSLKSNSNTAATCHDLHSPNLYFQQDLANVLDLHDQENWIRQELACQVIEHYRAEGMRSWLESVQASVAN